MSPIPDAPEALKNVRLKHALAHAGPFGKETNWNPSSKPLLWMLAFEVTAMRTFTIGIATDTSSRLVRPKLTNVVYWFTRKSMLLVVTSVSRIKAQPLSFCGPAPPRGEQVPSGACANAAC